jgi:hypothetical protein
MASTTRTPPGARRITVGWTHPETDEEFRVTGHYWPGRDARAPRWDSGGEPAEPAVFEPVEVVEDCIGGEVRPELLEVVREQLDDLTVRAGEDLDARDASAEEDAADGEREQRRLGGVEARS